jgi:hypothetical protein
MLRITNLRKERMNQMEAERRKAEAAAMALENKAAETLPESRETEE